MYHSAKDTSETKGGDHVKETEKSKKKKPPQNPLVNPGPLDVLLGRGKSNHHHQGNQSYEVLVDSNRERYKAATSRLEKVHITQTILVTIRQQGGWFLRYDKKRKGWFAIDEQTARKKIAQAIQYRDRTKRHAENTVALPEASTETTTEQARASSDHLPSTYSSPDRNRVTQVAADVVRECYAPVSFMEDQKIRAWSVAAAQGQIYEQDTRRWSFQGQSLMSDRDIIAALTQEQQFHNFTNSSDIDHDKKPSTNASFRFDKT